MSTIKRPSTCHPHSDSLTHAQTHNQSSNQSTLARVTMAAKQFTRRAARAPGRGRVVVVVALVGWWWCAILALLSQSVTCSITRSGIAATDRVYLESLALQGMQVSFDNTTVAANDWGQLRHLAPAAVVYPRSVEDIATVVAAVARSESDLTVAARGLGHSINGQAQVRDSFIFSVRLFACVCA